MKTLLFGLILFAGVTQADDCVTVTRHWKHVDGIFDPNVETSTIKTGNVPIVVSSWMNNARDKMSVVNQDSEISIDRTEFRLIFGGKIFDMDRFRTNGLTERKITEEICPDGSRKILQETEE